jgi:hypothetical protein
MRLFDELIESNQLYFLNGKFLNNANKLNNSLQELQVNN